MIRNDEVNVLIFEEVESLRGSSGLQDDILPLLAPCLASQGPSPHHPGKG
jgi:hypothetical protein